MEKQNDQIDNLQNELVNEILNADEILVRDIVAVGNGAHVNIPKKHIGKSCRIIVHKNKIEDYTEMKIIKKEEGNKK